MTSPEAGPQPFALADAIDAVRRELQDAQKRGVGQEVQFSVGQVELELQVEIGTSVRGEAGIQVWVVSAHGGGERSSTTSQTVRVQLNPVGPEGGELRVADRRSGADSSPNAQPGIGTLGDGVR
jgi:hypothetical protein